MKYRFSARKFLNLPGYHSIGLIEASVSDTRGLYDSTFVYPAECSLKIGNCDRQIDFTLDLGDEGRFENTLHKIDTFIDTFKELRKALVAEQRLYRRRVERGLDPDE